MRRRVWVNLVVGLIVIGGTDLVGPAIQPSAATAAFRPLGRLGGIPQY